MSAATNHLVQYRDSPESGAFAIDLANAMRDADSEHRHASLAKLGCTPLDARVLEVVAGSVDPDAPEVDFAQLIPRDSG